MSSDAATPKPEQADEGGVSPTTDAARIADALPGLRDAAFGALVREPSTGVGVISLDGQVVYLNEQAARIFHGRDARPEQFVGRFWRDHLPAEWVKERLGILREILVHGEPVQIRTIWRGYQHVTWISPIETAESENGVALFLTITRRESGDEQAESLSGKEERCVDSGVMRLGPLDALSKRELEVLALVGQGLTVSETARVLCRSEKTIESHITSIHHTLGVRDRVEMSEIARRAGLSLSDAERRRV
ncbi:MAG: hypothetical protein HUU19_04145 [Phycisphaerales bacterium]|jgi:DNA-binding CsgD family transcriptional regulator|nr:hypothetical protein [Phycisphaerales bacterium]